MLRPRDGCAIWRRFGTVRDALRGRHLPDVGLDVRDIEPKEFELIVMDGYLTPRTVEKVREVLESTDRRENMVNTNYEIASRHYSFTVLHRYLNMLLTNFFGVNM